MSLSVRFDRDLPLSHIDNGVVWLNAADDKGEPLSVTLPLADWSYLSSRPASAREGGDAHEFALSQIEGFLRSIELDAVPSSRLVRVVMTDRI
ncbi:hypothetical protein [Sphingomonas sp. PR090111-T3T-6A]|uniref:hypothetical protein n=1 Tax=Sphingomonas sp. PR090111-T3T-6A TaxID=685778 RepID=UPI000364D0F1|nr:hypothetical protein [Sphingomonas sp. PR090111-T3T-6A]